MLQIGSLLDGKYKILNKVGQGGMSVVYLAMNEKANKQWAVKEVRKDGIKDFEVVKQGLVAETDILKKLNHPNLPSIIDVIDKDDSFIIIMDYIQGNSLSEALKESGAQPQEEVIEWAKQLCDVLCYLHGQTPPIIYRDMKPSNIMLKPDGDVMLIDFGTAREFKESNLADTTCLGTIGYAAPEQFGGMGQTDARTDIYCLGATLYHLLTGRNPSEPPYEILPIRQVNPALSGGLEKIIARCTQRDPEDRYQSAAELMYALEHYNEMDDIYRKKQKKKLSVFTMTAALTLLFAMSSAFSYASAQSVKKSNYDYILANANSVQDYYEAIVTDPGRTEAYLGSRDANGLIKFLIADGRLDSEEAAAFSKLRGGLDESRTGGFTESVNVMKILQETDPKGYEDVCFQIGEAYLFYYDIGVPKDKYAAAAMWFQYAKEEYPIAGIYCDISVCLENIAKYYKAEQYSRLYEEYALLWTQMKQLCSDVRAYDDDLKVRVWNETVQMLCSNVSEFYETVGRAEMNAMLAQIRKESQQVDNAFLQKSMSRLQDNITLTEDKISTIRK